MYFKSKNIEVRFMEFDQLRRFIEEALRQVKGGEISKDEFVEAIESCFHSASPLSLLSGSRRHDDSRCKACPDATVSGSWDDCLILRATADEKVKGPEVKS